MPNVNSNPQRRLSFSWRLLTATSLALSASGCLFLACCYGSRADWFAEFRISPCWGWWFPGVLCMVPGLASLPRRFTWPIVTLWLLFVAIFSEEPRSLIRGFSGRRETEWTEAKQAGQAIRIVSLNCGDGGARAINEAAAY